MSSSLSGVHKPFSESVFALNPQQQEAVDYRGQALLIVAGAGSGKTRVLTQRIASLLNGHEAWPSQILAITFTNKAAQEMRERVQDLVVEPVESMWISTFHSACVKILRGHLEAFGRSNAFTIYDAADSRTLLKRLLKDRDSDMLGMSASSIAAKISRLKNDLIDAPTYARMHNADDPHEALVSYIFSQYASELRASNAFDFDDLIAETVYLFRTFPEIAALYQSRFRHILVDEYQDTNHAQYALIRELTKPIALKQVQYLIDQGRNVSAIQDEQGGIPGASLVVVGDSDQSIYAFRGADVRNIAEFEKDFTNAHVVLLEQNYRSTQHILNAANAVIGQNFDRQEKKLWSADGDGDLIRGYTAFTNYDEAQWVADRINELRENGVEYKDIAVFYRANAQTRALEDVFLRAAIPYSIMGGTKFYERAEIKDAIAYATAVVNPYDTASLLRILNKPRRGVGEVTQARIFQYASEHNLTFREALQNIEQVGLGAKLTNQLRSFCDLLNEAAQLTKPELVFEHLLKKSGYLDLFLQSCDPQDIARGENVQELIAVAAEFSNTNEEATLFDFLVEVALVAAVDELDDESGTVSLMTLHTAKGLEFDAVFIVGLEENMLPHRISIEEVGGINEERRLFYVGITRAKKRLFLSHALTRVQYGESEQVSPSRYLAEIPSGILEWGQSGRKSLSSSGTLSSFRTEPVKKWSNQIPTKIRDNSDLVLEAGDRVEHTSFGQGSIDAIVGSGKKRIAHIHFDNGERKKILVQIAPIQKM